MWRVPGNILYDLASPKPLDVATANFAGAYRLHDVEGIGQHFCVTLTPKVKVKGNKSGYMYLQWCNMDCCSSIFL